MITFEKFLEDYYAKYYKNNKLRTREETGQAEHADRVINIKHRIDPKVVDEVRSLFGTINTRIEAFNGMNKSIDGSFKYRAYKFIFEALPSGHHILPKRHKVVW